MKFSVIIPVYNVAPYLKACLDSVLAAAGKLPSAVQPSTFSLQPSVEIVCVDDGSTDESGAMLDAFRVKVRGEGERWNGLSLEIVHQANAGVSAARNRGLEIATGDWLLFWDADDVARDTLFTDLAELIVRHPEEDLFGFGLVPMSADSERPVWNQRLGSEVDHYDLSVFLPDHCAMLSACRFALRKSDFGDLRFPQYAHGEDLVYVAGVLARARSLTYLRREEYGYRMRPGSSVHSEMAAGIAGDAVRFHADMFRILADSGKRLGRGKWPMRLEQWILRLPILMAGHGRDAEWRRVYRLWIDSMREALGMPFVEGAFRRVAWLACVCPFQPIVTLASRIGLRVIRRHHIG